MLLTEILQKRANVGAGLATRLSIEAVEEVANQLTRKMIAQGHTSPEDAEAVHRQITRQLTHSQDELKNETYRKSRSVGAPVSPFELGLTGGINAGMGYALPRLTKSLDPHGELPTFGQAAKNVVAPVGLLGNSLMNTANILRAPMSDPLYREGKRSYGASVAEGLGGSIDNLAQSGREARERYGAFGIPVQMLHGIFNPVTSIAYGGRSIRDAVFGKQGAICKEAEQIIRTALE